MFPLSGSPRYWFNSLVLLALAGVSPQLLAVATETLPPLGITGEPLGIACLAIFTIALVLVVMEEKLHLPKSKPVIIAAGLIWILVTIAAIGLGRAHEAEAAARHALLEYAELFLFLLVAMTYISALTERRVFDALRVWLVSKGYSFRQLFWITGVLSFFISPIADNLTTALLMGAVVLSVAGSNTRFCCMAFVNIVVAANAGGAFSPFGDITTLMVWQSGKVEFVTFLALFLPSVVNYLIPAALISMFVPKEQPAATSEKVTMKLGAIRVMVLFLLTIATAVVFHNNLHLPPVFGMMMGLGYLNLFAYYLKRKSRKENWENMMSANRMGKRRVRLKASFDIFNQVARSEWDTLLFFYGVIMCVGGLGFVGYLAEVSLLMYSDWGATQANVLAGLLSAVVDNIPVMFAILAMDPQMDMGQWLLITLTAGTGGSLLAVGSAAGVALMGQSKGRYTFFGHLRWTPFIFLGYAASIVCHFLINGHYFDR